MAEILVGTSGYDYPEWRGVFYPQDLPRDEFLAFYSGYFNALEINYTYYGMPEERQIASMVTRSMERLQFSVKAHQSMTHNVTVSGRRDSSRAFREALLPMTNRGLLKSVLLQFPQSFHYAPDERRYLDNLVGELQGLPLVAEFRHRSWQNKRVWEGLEKRGVGWCICDMPELKNLPSSLQIVTGGAAYLRFHGRNAGSWYGTNARDRYEYDYTQSQLETFLPLVNSVAASSRLVQIYFNNHAKGHAVVNAQKMKILTQQSPG